MPQARRRFADRSRPLTSIGAQNRARRRRRRMSQPRRPRGSCSNLETSARTSWAQPAGDEDGHRRARWARTGGRDASRRGPSPRSRRGAGRRRAATADEHRGRGARRSTIETSRKRSPPMAREDDRPSAGHMPRRTCRLDEGGAPDGSGDRARSTVRLSNLLADEVLAAATNTATMRPKLRDGQRGRSRLDHDGACWPRLMLGEPETRQAIISKRRPAA